MKVFKYEVSTDFTLKLPEGYEVLSVMDQNNTPQMWIKVDDKAEADREVRFVAYGTVHDIDEDLSLKFIGTFNTTHGMFVFHLFEVLED